MSSATGRSSPGSACAARYRARFGQIEETRGEEKNMRLEIPAGERSIVLETGKFAKQAGGAVTARLGDTMVLSTATRSQAPRPGATFLPLSVAIEERMSSAGKSPGGGRERTSLNSSHATISS